MKQVLFLFVLALFFVSCQQELDEKSFNSERTELRKIDCTPSFTAGNVWEGLFNDPSAPLGAGATFNDAGWEGTFESELFPCHYAVPAGDCCNQSVVLYLDVLLPFSSLCNDNLDVQELNIVADEILAVAEANAPNCEGIVLTPYEVNVIPNAPLCCVYEPPCPQAEEPCDCYDDFPNDPYWECCETYILFLEVKYARTTDCRAVG